MNIILKNKIWNIISEQRLGDIYISVGLDSCKRKCFKCKHG